MSLLGPAYSFSTLSPESSQSLSQNSLSNPEDRVRRATIKQLLSAREARQGAFCIGQQPLGTFILVANVYRNHVLPSKSRISYGFDDGTGKISGYRTEAGTRYSTFAPFAYATIYGQLAKDSDNSVVVKVLYILPLTDAHEIYFHTLHVMFDDLRYKKGNPRKEDWLASQSHDHQIDGLVSALGGFDISANHNYLSELEQDVIACIKSLKDSWEAHDDVESLARGIQIGALVHELSRDHEDKDALDFWGAIERLLKIDILRTTINDNHLDFA